MNKSKKQTKAPEAPKVTATTTFKQFVLAQDGLWPLAQSDPSYPALRDAYSAAKKAAIQDGPKEAGKPNPEPTVDLKPSAAASTGASKVKKVATAKTKVEALPDDVMEEIEAEVRSHTVRPCGCGCGVETRASYLPGHDAKLRSRLIGEARARLVGSKAQAA